MKEMKLQPYEPCNKLRNNNSTTNCTSNKLWKKFKRTWRKWALV